MSKYSRTERWFLGSLSARSSLLLIQDLIADRLPSERFDKLVAIERCLAGRHPDRPLWTQHDSERGEAMLLSRLGFKTKRRRSPALMWAVAFGFLTSVLAIILVWPTDQLRPKEKSFASRGGTLEQGPLLSLFCITQAGVPISMQMPVGSGGTNRKPSCSMDDEFQFVLSNQQNTLRYLYVLGIDGTGTRMWYFPEPGGTSIRIVPEQENQLLGESIVLGVNHHVGDLRVFALFSPSPLTDPETKAAIQQISASPDVLHLPVVTPEIVQQSLQVRITESQERR